MVRFRAIVLAVLPILAACGVDPGDVAAFERSRILEAVPVGSNYHEAASALVRLGYTCKPGGGIYTDEAGQPAAANEFMKCSSPAIPNELCKLGASVVVLPSPDRVAGIVFKSDYTCH